MLTLHGQASSNGSPTVPLAEPKLLWSRVWFVASLLLAAGAGALAVNVWKPAHIHLVEPAAVVVPTAVPKIAIGPLRMITLDQLGRSLPNGSWVSANSVTFRVTVPSVGKAMAARVEAEVVPSFAPLIGQANARSESVKLMPRTDASVRLTASRLADGLAYHWQMRAVFGAQQDGPWQYGGLFGVNTTAPLPPVLAATNVAVGGWTRVAQPLFRWVAGGGLAPTQYYEYRLVQAKAQGVANTALAWRRMTGQALRLPRLADGTWSVEVRAVDMAGNRSIPAVWAFNVQRKPPAAPRVVAAIPSDSRVSNVITPTAALALATTGAPVAKVQYTLTYGDEQPAGWRTLHGLALVLPGLGDGAWTAWVRSVNVVGEISAPVPWHFVLDRQHPLLTTPSLSAGSFTEATQAERVSFGLGTPATISYQVFADGSAQPVAARTLGLVGPGPIKGLSWNGRSGSKSLAPQGSYHMVIRAVDAAGNASDVTTPSFTLLSKRIVVSISKEALWAYDGSKLVTYSLVTNGGPDTPTVPGIYHVEWKVAGLVMHSPWPKSSPLYYPPSPTNFALLYNANGGFYLHDAPWRWHFGPGSNTVAGQPGGSYTGTHGCTNVPYAVMKQLFNWADNGTLIQIVA